MTKDIKKMQSWLVGADTHGDDSFVIENPVDVVAMIGDYTLFKKESFAQMKDFRKMIDRFLFLAKEYKEKNPGEILFKNLLVGFGNHDIVALSLYIREVVEEYKKVFKELGVRFICELDGSFNIDGTKVYISSYSASRRHGKDRFSFKRIYRDFIFREKNRLSRAPVGKYSVKWNEKRKQRVEQSLLDHGYGVVLTHPPIDGVLDENGAGLPCGDIFLKGLYEKMTEKPLYWVSGHIHEARGEKVVGKTTFLNVSMADYGVKLDEEGNKLFDDSDWKLRDFVRFDLPLKEKKNNDPRAKEAV